MFARDGQVTLFHSHYVYIEDIINRGGGDLCVELWNGDKDGANDVLSVTLQDVRKRVVNSTSSFAAGFIEIIPS